MNQAKEPLFNPCKGCGEIFPICYCEISTSAYQEAINKHKKCLECDSSLKKELESLVCNNCQEALDGN